jgi:hypothetical protein
MGRARNAKGVTVTRFEDEYPIDPPVSMQFEPPAPPRRRRSPVGIAVGIVVALAVTGGGVWAVFNEQLIVDQITVWQFAPSPAVEAHVDRLALTDHGRFLYYASSPLVSDRDVFATECPPREDEKNFGILGCYLPGAKIIYLFDVTDERLDGTEEVTAAHEMLHAAWDRMSSSTRARISGLLEDEYSKQSVDAELVERMQFYERTQPGERSNELHSIIGTEFSDLSPELEDYYSGYFADRSIVVALHVASNAAFVELQSKADALVDQLATLRDSIENDYSDYTTGYAALNASVSDFNRRAAIPGEFASQSEFDNTRNALRSRRDVLDSLYSSVTARSAQYQALLLELEGVNSTAAELQRGLNIGAEEDSGL